MKVHKIEILVVDFDECGAEEITRVLENQKYPNYCISPSVQNITTVDVDWTDDHPLNHRDKCEDEYKRLFRGTGGA